MVKFPDTPLTETAWIRVVLFTGILSLQYLFAIVSWVNQCLTLFWVPFFRIKQGMKVENKIWLYNRKNINFLLHYYKCNIKYSCNLLQISSCNKLKSCLLLFMVVLATYYLIHNTLTVCCKCVYELWLYTISFQNVIITSCQDPGIL